MKNASAVPIDSSPVAEIRMKVDSLEQKLSLCQQRDVVCTEAENCHSAQNCSHTLHATSKTYLFSLPLRYFNSSKFLTAERHSERRLDQDLKPCPSLCTISVEHLYNHVSK